MTEPEGSSDSIISPEQEVDQNDSNATTQPQGGDGAAGSTTPPPAGVSDGGGPSRPRRRRRVRTSDPGASSSGGGARQRRRGELDAPSFDPVCYVCNKSFGSWKAVFGHLRAHPRATPGAFPPPKFTPEASPERKNEAALRQQLAPALLDLAQQTLRRLEEQGALASSLASSSSRKGVEIDLNRPSGSSPAGNVRGFDLNLPPPPEEEKEEEDDNDGDDNMEE